MHNDRIAHLHILDRIVNQKITLWKMHQLMMNLHLLLTALLGALIWVVPVWFVHTCIGLMAGLKHR